MIAIRRCRSQRRELPLISVLKLSQKARCCLYHAADIVTYYCYRASCIIKEGRPKRKENPESERSHRRIIANVDGNSRMKSRCFALGLTCRSLSLPWRPSRFPIRDPSGHLIPARSFHYSPAFLASAVVFEEIRAEEARKALTFSPNE